ncbi:MAG: sodium:proton antiporter NhaD [Planctomycetes bacterium]|nr:sodium:proton antiporter NhaD [Planctomycetota bacterium]
MASNGYAIVALVVFVLAYTLVVTEDLIHLRKSKPVIFAAGLIWLFTALAFEDAGLMGGDHPVDLAAQVKHHVSDFAELFLFLMVAMTYISAIGERNVFLRINAWLVSAGFGLRAVFWVTGALAFMISPIADNLTTALLMGAVVVTVGRGNPRFISMACINVVVAANAGGAFSPFGDITTLMVWAAHKVEALEFVSILVPSLVNWLVPAAIMAFFLPNTRPEPMQEHVELKEGWLIVIVLFLLTIVTAVIFHARWHLPPFLGMTTGLAYFMFYGFTRQRRVRRHKKGESVDVLQNVAEVEWDTLLFFFGVIMCVGGLAELGFLLSASVALYDQYGALPANIAVGVVSAVLDNVPVMFAVLKMDPTMGTTTAEQHFQWLLITLTAGVGGSMLSVGSAAGVALMGTARGMYTFAAHLRWTPVVVLGYAASIWVHWLLNGPKPAG